MSPLLAPLELLRYLFIIRVALFSLSFYFTPCIGGIKQNTPDPEATSHEPCVDIIIVLRVISWCTIYRFREAPLYRVDFIDFSFLLYLFSWLFYYYFFYSFNFISFNLTSSKREYIIFLLLLLLLLRTWELQ